MRLLFLFIFAILLLCPLDLRANSIDSLETALTQSDDDYQRLSILQKLLRAYAKIDIKQALPYAEQAVELSRKVESDSLLGNFLISHGAINVNLGKVEVAQESFDEALALYQKNKNSEGIANVYERLIYVEMYKRNNYDLALDYSYKALKIYEDLNLEHDQLIIYGKIADILSKQGDIEDSNEWAEKMLNKSETKDYQKNISTALSILGTNYKKQGKYPEALENYDRLLKIYSKNKDLVRLAITYSNRASALISLKKYDEALESTNKSYEYSEQSKFMTLFPVLWLDRGKIYFEKKNFRKSIDCYSQAVALSEAVGGDSNLPEMHKGLSETYEALGDYKNALANLKIQTALNDSLFNEDKELIINELNTKYQTEQKEQKIALLSEKEKTQAAEITAARNRNFLLLGLLGMLLLGGRTFYYRRQLNEQLRLQSVRTQISSDLHDEVGSSLAQLSMIMGSVEGADPAVAKNYLQKGNEVLMSSISKIRDVVWAIDAGNDSTGSLLDRMEDFAYDMLSAKNIKYKISNEGFDRKANLPPLIRQNFYLFYKEAITNIAKHSNADEVKIDFSKKGKNLSLKIADNGKDLNDKKVSGSGLSNMKLRAKKIGGTFDFDASEKGVSVNLNASIV